MKIIAFTGMPFSGKSEAVQIVKKMNIPVIRMGEQVWEEVKHRGLSLSNENVGSIACEMRNKYGNDIWAKRTIDKIQSLNQCSLVVIDGVRNHEEVEAFKKKLGKDFVLIAVVVDDSIRFERALKRKRVDDSNCLEDIKQRDNRERSWGIEGVIDSADVVIRNNESLQLFQQNVGKCIDELTMGARQR